MSFREILPEELAINPFTTIGKEWMLITAGNVDKVNTMTVSWGGVGVFWGKNVVTTYVRPQRYTKEFIDQNDTFSLSVYGNDYKKILGYLGKVSGRDEDKIKESGLTVEFDGETPYFEEAKLVFICKKLCEGDISPENFDAKENDEKWYPNKDYHRMYISEIKKILVRE